MQRVDSPVTVSTACPCRAPRAFSGPWAFPVLLAAAEVYRSSLGAPKAVSPPSPVFEGALLLEVDVMGRLF